MRVSYSPQKMKYRGEEYDCVFISFKDDETGETYTTTESDTVWFNQVTNQYREKHGIPYTDEIVALRERYGLSAAKMSTILGFGANQYRLYEEGEVPSESNGKMIRSAMNPNTFQELVNSTRHQLSDREFEKISSAAKDAIVRYCNSGKEQWASDWVYQNGRGQSNGFAPQSVARLKNLLLYVLDSIGETFQTKMNKVLFYIDFLSYREHGMAISGLAYNAIEFGPVPQRWDRVYSAFEEISQQPKLIQNQECLALKAGAESDMSDFTEDEIRIIDAVCAKMSKMNAQAATRMSHEENAWKEYVGKHETIPFSEAFSLVGM